MNLGLGEGILILFIAFVVVGPKDLPKIGRAIGKALRQLRGLYGSVKQEMNLDEALTALRKTVGAERGAPEELSALNRELKQLGTLIDPGKH